MRGLVQISQRPHWRLELQANLAQLGLEELEWISPSYLAGSTGEVTGDVTLRVGDVEEPYLATALAIEEPGGLLQARFFDLLAPYLPAINELRRHAAKHALVAFRDARVKASLPATDRLEIFLHISVPEYNLDLNARLEIHVDERDILKQCVRLIGLVRPP